MSLKKIHEMLVQLAETPSSNDKKEMLKRFLQNKKFATVIRYALDERMKYNINKTPAYFEVKGKKPKVKEIFKFLDKLNEQNGATDKDKINLFLCAGIDQETHEVISRVVKKDLKCGCGVKLINEAVPNTVYYRPYMRCSTEKKIDRIIYDKVLGAIVQEKADGTYVDVEVDGLGEAKFYTRNYSKVHQLHKLKAIIKNGSVILNGKKIVDKGIMDKTFKGGFLNRVYQGELVVVKEGKVLDRKTGNGIINQCIQKTALQSDADCVCLRLWDSVPLKEYWEGIYKKEYNSRLRKISKFIASVNNSAVQLIETQRVFSLEEAQAFYRRMRKLGKEGAVLKNVFGFWKDYTSPDQIKMKNISDAELRVVEWEFGDKGKKFEKCMGRLHLQTDDQQLKVSVGTGFSDEDRSKQREYYLGKIVTVEFESIIKDKKSNTYSLFLPRFVEIREDRNDTDTLEDLLTR